MTIVYVNASDNNSELTAVSDSKISGIGLRLESAAKILVLPVRSFRNDGTVSHSTSNGFAFSGSTLVAQTLFAFASSSLQCLRMEVGVGAPSLEDIAQFVSKHLRRLVQELGENGMTPQRVKTGIFIFGYCPILNTRRLFRLDTLLEGFPIDVGIQEFDVSAKSSGYILGELTAFAHFVEANGLSRNETVKNIRLAIESGVIPTIGGDIQIVRADKNGARSIPTRTGEQNILMMLNYNMNDEVVGECHFKHEALLLD